MSVYLFHINDLLSVHIGHKKKPRSIEEATKLFLGSDPECQNFPESEHWLSELNSYWRGTKNDPRSATGSKHLDGNWRIEILWMH